jgi:hypothetical protein
MCKASLLQDIGVFSIFFAEKATALFSNMNENIKKNIKENI